MQNHSDGTPRLIEWGSRSLSDTESRYATIELGFLGISWALEKCKYYLVGCPRFSTLTDHRLLPGLFAKPLQAIDNPRLFRFRK